MRTAPLGPFCMLFYLYGSLQYFADVRAAYDKMVSDAAPPASAARAADSAPGSEPHTVPTGPGARSSSEAA